ncbi:MAG TPA: hypothetical protein VI248_20415 [Kineosporiaceae bacterium]
MTAATRADAASEGAGAAPEVVMVDGAALAAGGRGRCAGSAPRHRAALAEALPGVLLITGEAQEVDVDVLAHRD